MYGFISNSLLKMTTARNITARCINWSIKKIVFFKGFISLNLRSLILNFNPSINKCISEMIIENKKKFTWNERVHDNANTIRICKYNFPELKPFFFLSSDHSFV
jgi:hypothetical protein